MLIHLAQAAAEVDPVNWNAILLAVIGAVAAAFGGREFQHRQKNKATSGVTKEDCDLVSGSLSKALEKQANKADQIETKVDTLSGTVGSIDRKVDLLLSAGINTPLPR